MARYIDAEKIIDSVLRHYTDAERSGQFNFSPSEIKQNFADTIENIPTADVKPIVYCKDCKFQDDIKGCIRLNVFVDKNTFYCEYAMRKEQNE